MKSSADTAEQSSTAKRESRYALPLAIANLYRRLVTLLVASATNDCQQYEQHQNQSKIVESSVEQTHTLSLLCQQLIIMYVRIAKRDWTSAHTVPISCCTCSCCEEKRHPLQLARRSIGSSKPYCFFITDCQNGIVLWIIGPVSKAISTVPMETGPPKAAPAIKTVTSIISRTF